MIGRTIRATPVLLTLALTGASRAQAPGDVGGPPTIASILPPGATIGKATTWTVAGTNLARVVEWRIAGEGVRVAASEPGDAGRLTLKVEVAPGTPPGYREVRAVAPGGLSNLVVIRVDALEQAPEVEPNDAPEAATNMVEGAASWGVLKAQDLDYYRFRGRAGRRVTIDVEAQRIGTPIAPVVTVIGPGGVALGQGRETRGVDRDARLSVVLPADGNYLVQVRDNLYAGGDSAAYRLRVEEAAFATGMAPLSGRAGERCEVTISGGNLAGPRSKVVTLPDAPGSLFDPGPFDGPGGLVVAPMKVLVSDAPAIRESRDGTPTSLSSGGAVDGVLDQAGEVDRFTIDAKKGMPLMIRVRASEMGSWLDSVVTIRDASGGLLAENDDPAGDTNPRNGFALNQAASTPDSRLTFEPTADGPITVEVADRYGDGGPEYGYRLEVGANRPDFGISLLFANPSNVNQPVASNRGAPRRAATPGSNGSLNLKPGQTIPINFLITSEGKTGPIEVHAEGLPPGVTASPKTVKGTAAPAGRNAAMRALANADSLVLKVDPDAAPGFGDLRIVAVAHPEGGPEITRTALAAVAIDTPLPGAAAPRPVMRTLASLPVRVVGEMTGAAAPAPSASEAFDFRGVSHAGTLLQGGRVEMALDLRPRARAAREASVEAKVSGKGVTAQAIVAGPDAPADQPAAIVRVTAAVDAEPGARPVTIRVASRSGAVAEREETVLIKPPVVVKANEAPLTLVAGGGATLWVGVEREPGYDGPVEIKLDLPKGVRASGKLVVPKGVTSLEIPLTAPSGVEAEGEVRVTAVARMPRGPVRAESSIRPMIRRGTAETGR